MTDGMTNKRNGGAVSIQVVFLMLVLVTLGAFAIVSARANYNFSVKALDWNRMYYALEDDAERFVMTVDGILKDAVAASSSSEQYISTVREELEWLDFTYPSLVIATDGDALNVTVNLTSATNENANLRVVLAVSADVNDKRYHVREWVQWQSPPESEGGMSLWDGFF